MQSRCGFLNGAVLLIMVVVPSYALAAPDPFPAAKKSGGPVQPMAIPDAPFPINTDERPGLDPGTQCDVGAQDSELPIDAALNLGSPGSAYLSLTARDRFHAFVQHINSRAAIADTLVDTGRAQFQKDWPGYGQGLLGFEKRYGAVVVGRVSSSFFSTYLFPSLLHQDPHYLRLGAESSIFRRGAYAVSRVGIARNSAGGATYNGVWLFSTIVTASLANAYYPRQQRGLSQTLGRIQGSAMDRVESNLSTEFLPDIEHLVWTHLPTRLKQLSRRLPPLERWAIELNSEAPLPSAN